MFPELLFCAEGMGGLSPHTGPTAHRTAERPEVTWPAVAEVGISSQSAERQSL